MSYMVTSPTFSEFRAGEPTAYEIAIKVVNKVSTNKFTSSYETKDLKAKVVGKGDIVYVYLNGDERPFTFSMMEV